MKQDKMQENRKILFTALALFLFSALMFANTLSNEFVGYDDQNLIQNTTTIRSLSPESLIRMFTPKLRGNYQPIRTLSYALDYALWGLNPVGFHLTNIFFHALSVVGVWLLLRRVFSEKAALFSAAIFAVLPIHVENVAWMSSRKDVLSLAFFLLAILFYEESSAHKSAGFYAGSLLAAALALLSKLTAVTIPLCILLLEICRDGWPDFAEMRRKIVRLSPHFILVGIVIALNFLQLQPTVQHGDALAALEEVGRPAVHDVWLSMPLAVLRYIRLTLVPYHLSTHYDVARITHAADARFWIPALLLCAIIGSSIFLFFRGKRAAAFCIAWSFITFLPTSNIIPTAAVLVDRYMHLPSIGIAGLLGMAMAYPLTAKDRLNNPSLQRLSTLSAILLILLFSLLTLRRNTDWKNTDSLFSRTLMVNPKSVDARLALGGVLEKEGMYDSAIDMYRQGLEIAPQNYRILYNLGLVYLKKGWKTQAVRALENARAANPQFSATRFNLALAYQQQGRIDDAIAEHEANLKLDPHFALSYGALGRIFLEKGDYEQALRRLNEALREQPDLIPALADRAELLMRQGKNELARQDLQKLASLGMDISKLHSRPQ